MPVRMHLLRFLGLNFALSYLRMHLEKSARARVVPVNALVWYILAQPSQIPARVFLPLRKVLRMLIVEPERQKLSRMSFTENQNPAIAIRVLH